MNISKKMLESLKCSKEYVITILVMSKYGNKLRFYFPVILDKNIIQVFYSGNPYDFVAVNNTVLSDSDCSLLLRDYQVNIINSFIKEKIEFAMGDSNFEVSGMSIASNAITNVWDYLSVITDMTEEDIQIMRDRLLINKF